MFQWHTIDGKHCSTQGFQDQQFYHMGGQEALMSYHYTESQENVSDSLYSLAITHAQGSANFTVSSRVAGRFRRVVRLN